MKTPKQWKPGDMDANADTVNFGARFDHKLQDMLRAVALLSPQQAKDTEELNQFAKGSGATTRASWKQYLKERESRRQQYLTTVMQKTEAALASRDGSWFRQLAELLDSGDQADHIRRALMVWAGCDGSGKQTVFLTAREITDRLWAMGEEVDERHVRRLCEQLGIALSGKVGRPRKSDNLKSRES